MKKIFTILCCLLILNSCHSKDRNQNSGGSGGGGGGNPDVQEQSKPPAGDPDTDGPFPLQMIFDAQTVQKTLSKFKLVILNGYCTVEPTNLDELKRWITFDGSKATIEVRSKKCVRIIEFKGEWSENAPHAQLYLSNGILRSLCPDDDGWVSDNGYAFIMDESRKYFAITSANDKHCYWAKKVE